MQTASLAEHARGLEGRLAESREQQDQVIRQLQAERESTEELSQSAAQGAARLARMEGTPCTLCLAASAC